ncbi:MAG: beta-class carbonic anhydrase [Actinomycetes bacterium]
MFESLLTANRRYAQGFALPHLPGRAAKGFALISCMDSRIEPLVMLGLAPGDAKILRNAGGRVTADVLRSLVLATTFLGVTHVAVMHHTDCALANRDENEVRSALTDEQQAATPEWDFLSMPDPDAALNADVRSVRTSAALPGALLVEGWRYDVRTGQVHRVVPAVPIL